MRQRKRFWAMILVLLLFFNEFSTVYAASDDLLERNDDIVLAETDIDYEQSLPEIKSIKVEKKDASSALNVLDFGVFGNGSVSVTVEAVGTYVEQETTIYLGDNGAYESKIATSELKNDGKYYYTAVFTFDVSKSMNLEAYAVNSSGTGSKYTKISGISDLDGNNKTVDDKLFVLERDLPEITEYAFKSNNSQVECDITISDINSGIAKVEYGWDLDSSFCDYEKNLQTGHNCGFGQNNYSNQYIDYDFDNSDIVNVLKVSLELNHADSVWVKNNQHMVYLRVTDNAGNMYDTSLQDAVGSDMNPPNIISIEIKKAKVSALEAVLRFLTFGTFSNDSVEIAIVADDTSIDGTYASGINAVTVNDGNDTIMAKNEEGEYILTVPADSAMEDLSITVKDEAGWTITKKVTEIFDEMGVIKSDDLIVEDDKPTISWDFISGRNVDDTGRIWLGAEDITEPLEITVSDNTGVAKSGLHSFKITYNGITVCEKTDFSSLQLEYTAHCRIDDFEDGVHTIVVTVEDNAGNIRNESRTFYIDSIPPESGTISILSPECIIIDDKQWFDKDEMVTFRADFSDANSGVNNITMRINEQSFHFSHDEIRSDDNGYYVIVDTQNLNSDSEHKYTVTGVATDFANNTVELETMTIYKDLDNPNISKITVENKNASFGKGHNVLPFGAYANDTMLLKIYAEDAKFDSGIDYVTVNFEGLSVPQILTDNGKGVFSTEIPVGTEIYVSDITVMAYDKYGRSSMACPNLEDAQNGDLSNSRFVMIEQILPAMTLALSEGDDATRNDGQKWYKTNKIIELTVQDKESGIHNINFAVNGVDITTDIYGVDLLKASTTKLSDTSNTEEHKYFFNTDYITEQVGVPVDGKYAIYVEITDNAGNVKTYEEAYYIDKEPPQIYKVGFSTVTIDGINETTEFIEELRYGFYFKTDFIATVYVTDGVASSGLDEINYRLVSYQNGMIKEETTGSQKIAGGKATLMVPAGFRGQIFVEAFDNLANSSGEKTTEAYVVDGSAPDINIISNVSTSYHDALGNKLYVENNSITVEVTDMVSGIREIGYSQRSEQNSTERMTVLVNDGGYTVGDSLGDGWTVLAVDENLVTKAAKTFLFDTDDNDVVLIFDVADNATNKRENVETEKFTIDKTSPIINISFREDEDDNVYYNQNRIADITVIDRNFDENRIKVDIENELGIIPSFAFSEKSKTEYVAVVEFDEGDYTFNVTGTDFGNHVAIVNFSGGNENKFCVDKTKPLIEDNFALFTNIATENSFNVDKTVTITVREHNFEPAYANLYITRKDAGADHNAYGLVDVTTEVLEDAKWESVGDNHTISFTLSKEGVYQIGIAPSDLADNIADQSSTVVFEIDKTVPIVAAKNGIWVSDDDTEYLDIYAYLRKDEPAPTVEFSDLNIDYIKYNLTVYIPEQTSSDDATIIRPVKVYLEEDSDKSGKIWGNKFVLPNFVEDGVYALQLTAVDVAGNESLLNVNTYVRIVDQDVLAYVMESDLEHKTGLYSFQYENGDAISKRPDNFSDIKIFVLAKEDTNVDVVLRDNNGNEFNTNAQATTDDSVYGMNIYNFTVDADFFKENFQDDTDNQLYLTVKNEDNRIDLGKMHIDNIAPTCDIPEEFKSWQWYYGEDERTIMVSNISELIDVSQCKVYDNGMELEFTYSSETNSIEFVLGSGWHNVGIILNDMAGNAYNIQEKSNIHIGFFWLWFGVGVSVVLVSEMIYAIIYYTKKKQVEATE